MTHNARKKRGLNEGKSKGNSVTEESLVAEHAPECTAPDRQRGGSQIPFYDDHNHVAYGWQQMTVLPDVYNLVRGSRDDPSLSPRSRPQTWPVEQQNGDEDDEPSGFDPHPGHGQGPRRPRPLTESEGGVHQAYGGRGRFKPFVDPVAAEQEDAGAGADGDRDGRASLALTSKDVNQKLGDSQSQEPRLKLTGSRGKSQRRSNRLIVDELETTQQADREAKHMAPLPEEPAPLQVCKKRADKTAEKRSSAETGCNMGVEKEMEGLMAAIMEQISGFAVQSKPRLEQWNPRFEHRSAVPKPLDLGAIEAAKEKRRRAMMETGASERARGSATGQGRIASVESLASGAWSELEAGSSEHNGARRKWYRGFRRSE